MSPRVPLIAFLLAFPALGLAQAARNAGETAPALAQREAEQAAARADRLDRDAFAAKGEAEQARAEAEALIGRIEANETGISAAEAQLRQIDLLRAALREDLAERQQPLIRLTAALQTIARRPPSLALVQPGLVQDTARIRALLNSTLPVIQQRTAALRRDLAAGDRLRIRREQALQALAASRNELKQRRVALARLQASQLQRSDALAQSALFQSDRSIAFTEEARSLTGQMNRSAFEAKMLRELATLPTPPARPSAESSPRPHRAAYRLPVQGRVLTGFGEISEGGIHSRGLQVQAAPDATVVAPRAGRIVYAGGFRSYGQIIIVDHGGGWTTTITNLAALRVAKGDKVVAGDPLGRVGRDAPVGIELRRNGRPQPVVAFL